MSINRLYLGYFSDVTMSMEKSGLIVALLHLVYYNVYTKPVNNVIKTVEVDSKSFDFLREKGYLASWVRNDADKVKYHKAIVTGLKMFQNYAGIPNTGKLDDLTKEYMGKRRCGMADVINGRRRKRRYNFQESKWKNTTITWAVENRNNDGISDYDVRRLLRVAFDKWESVTNLHFDELVNQPPRSATIRIRFETGAHIDDLIAFDGRGGTYAHAFFPEVPLIYEEDLSGDIHFDDAEKFTIQKGASKDYVQLLRVAIHEIGHSLGLEHSDAKGSIMYAIYQDNDNRGDFDLSYDDISGIQQIYGRKLINISRVVKTSTKIPTVHPTVECTDVMKAAFVGDNEKLHFVNGNKLYMLHDENEQGVEMGPIDVSSYFKGLQIVDSVFRRPTDKLLVVFHGDKFSVYQDKILKYPARKINDGFQAVDVVLEDIDAAFIWPDNNKLYIFKGEIYWRFSQLNLLESTHTDYIADFGYPQIIVAKWKGLPRSVDTVFQWSNNKMYFTKDKLYYRWNKLRREVNSGYPIKLTRSFLNCHTRQKVAIV